MWYVSIENIQKYKIIHFVLDRFVVGRIIDTQCQYKGKNNNMYDGEEGRRIRRKERIVTSIIVLLLLLFIITFTTGCTTLKTAFSTPVIELKVITEADVQHKKQ